ncbi:MAG TPA: protein kinase [Myxococcales bacterium]|nr:protein kinase [Myxococcales bacterium]
MARFGPYDLLQKLGTGATAEVHLAVGPNKAGASLFALKILLPHLSERPELRDQLLREAKLASFIHHPNVAEVFDTGEEEGRVYLAMEYVRGRPLSALLRALREQGPDGAGALTRSEACFIIREAALGLHEAHEAVDSRRRPLNLVHRDVSPQNVMVREDGRIKVVDFGLAKVTASEEAIAFTVGGPGIKGKLPYMPPEQVRNEPYDRRVDVFAACAVLFELLCGRRLYPGTTEAELIQQALTLPLPDPLALAPDLPPELAEVLGRGLERDPQRRTGTAAELAEALGPFLTGEPKGQLASRMEQFFDPMPRTVEEARMAALAQRTSGQSLGAVRPITRSRSGADVRARPPTVELTAPGAAFPSALRTDPMATDPFVTGPHSDLKPLRIHPQEMDLPTVAEVVQDADPEPAHEPQLELDPNRDLQRTPAVTAELPLIRPEVTGPVSEGAIKQALEPPTSIDPAVAPTHVRPAKAPDTEPVPEGARRAAVLDLPTRANPVLPTTDVSPLDDDHEVSDTRVDEPLSDEEPDDERHRLEQTYEEDRDLEDARTRGERLRGRNDRRPGSAGNRRRAVRPSSFDDRDLDGDGPDPDSALAESSSFTPTPYAPPPGAWRTAISRVQLQLGTQKTVVVLAAVAALGGLGVGVLIKHLTTDDEPPPAAPRAPLQADRPVEPPRPQVSAKGQVVILADPMAVVMEDGRELGTTPYVGDHPAGFHRFQLRSTDGLLSGQVEVTVHPGEQVTRRVSLRDR